MLCPPKLRHVNLKTRENAVSAKRMNMRMRAQMFVLDVGKVPERKSLIFRWAETCLQLPFP